MKSTIFSIIPLVGLALAQEGCTRRTVTKTETEKTYVSVQPSQPFDITIPSTIDSTTTITVRPSSSVEATATGLHWGSYPNGTYSNHTGRPQPILSSVSLDYTPSAITETPAPTYIPGQGYEQSSETGKAAIPTFETPAAAESSSTYEAPATFETAAASEPAETAQADAVSAAASRSGKATFYGGNTSGGKCSK